MLTKTCARLLAALLLGAAAISSASCKGAIGVSPQMLQNMNDMADALNALRQDSAVMQGQIDSLRTVIAKQDTTVRNLQLGLASALNR